MSMPLTISTHRKIIEAIHQDYAGGRAFALRDLISATGVSSSSVIRTLRLLKILCLVLYSKRANMGRHYRVSSKWPTTLSEAIYNFELAKILRV
jgi:hypothetical protein